MKTEEQVMQFMKMNSLMAFCYEVPRLRIRDRGYIEETTLKTEEITKL
jgi:hypothetical protein